MERSILDALYVARPANAFRKAFAETLPDPQTCLFLRDHAAALTLDQLHDLLQRERVPDDTWPGVAPFVKRLADLLVEAASSGRGRAYMVPLQRVLELAPVNPRSWLRDDGWRELVDITRSRLPPHAWWWLVEHARGGRIFNALNANPVELPGGFVHFEEIYETRIEPLVVPLVDDPLNEHSALAYLLALPMRLILDVMARVPDLVRREDVEPVARARSSDPVGGDDWSPPLPEWLAPYVPARARTCPDEEAFALYRWLEEHRANADELFGLALSRLEAVLKECERLSGEPDSVERSDAFSACDRSMTGWYQALGAHLTTGTAWKANGRRLIEWLVDRGLVGFPPSTLEAALQRASDQDGASAEEHREAILRKAHDVAGRVFVDRAEAAMRAGDWERAEHLLDAFATLEPGKFLRGPIHHLRSIEGAQRLVARLDACDSLLKTGGRTPTADDFLYAFRVLGGMP